MRVVLHCQHQCLPLLCTALLLGSACGRFGFGHNEGEARRDSGASIDSSTIARANQLSFSVIPADPTRTMAPFLVEVTAINEMMAIDTTFTGQVTVSLDNAGAAVLAGTLQLQPSAGVARFESLTIDRPGSDYVIRASSTGLSPATTPPFSLRGQPRWVDSANGNDSNTPCTEASTPCATVATAVSQAACWDSILLHGANTHTGPVVISRRCSTGAEIALAAWPNTGRPEIHATGGGQFALRIADADNIAVMGLRLTSQQFNGIEITRANGTIVRDCIIEDAGSAGIIVGQSSGVVVDATQVIRSSGRLLSLAANTGSLTITNNYLEGGEVLFSDDQAATVVFANNRLQAAALQIRDSGPVLRNNIVRDANLCMLVRASNLVVENNTFYNINSDCIRLDQAGSGNLIRNNAFSQISGFGIADWADNEPDVHYNSFSNNMSGACQNLDAGKCNNGTNGNIRHSDPLFANTVDFYPQSTAGHFPFAEVDDANSPLIDAGDPSSPFANEPGNNGGRVNIGAWGNTARASRSP